MPSFVLTNSGATQHIMDKITVQSHKHLKNNTLCTTDCNNKASSAPWWWCRHVGSVPGVPPASSRASSVAAASPFLGAPSVPSEPSPSPRSVEATPSHVSAPPGHSTLIYLSLKPILKVSRAIPHKLQCVFNKNPLLLFCDLL